MLTSLPIILDCKRIAVALIGIGLGSCTLYQEPTNNLQDSGTTQLDAQAPLAPTMSIAPTSYIKASNPSQGHRFGHTVAASGDTLAVGAPMNPGREVYVFVRDGDSWREQAKLRDPVSSNNRDHFGECLAISNDVIAVGLQRADAGAGVVHLYERVGDGWTFQSTLRASNADEGDHFGCPVALDGNTLVVGARDEDSNGVSPEDNNSSNSGAAYIFERSGNLWEEQAYLKAVTSGVGDYFGMRIAIDGDLLAISALLEDGGDSGVGGDPYNDGFRDSGAVYTYTRTNSIWNFDSYIKLPIEWNRTRARFGIALALKDGVLAIGAQQSDWGYDTITHILQRTNEAWEFESSFVGNYSYNGEPRFGGQIQLSGDYLTTMIDVNNGVVSIYKKESGSYALWATLDRVNEAIQSHALFGSTIVTGVPQDASNAVGINGNSRDSSTTESGAANVYELQ